jgi:hypothetical protein
LADLKLLRDIAMFYDPIQARPASTCEKIKLLGAMMAWIPGPQSSPHRRFQRD